MLIKAKFYENKSRWAFTLQISILQDMYEKHIEALTYTDDIIFFERNPITSLLFVENSYENNYFNDIEYKHYMRLHKLLSWEPDQIFKLDVPSNICYDRILSRMDPAIRTGLSLQYVEMLDEKYKSIECEYLDGTKSINETVNIILDKLDVNSMH